MIWKILIISEKNLRNSLKILNGFLLTSNICNCIMKFKIFKLKIDKMFFIHYTYSVGIIFFYFLIVFFEDIIYNFFHFNLILTCNLAINSWYFRTKNDFYYKFKLFSNNWHFSCIFFPHHQGWPTLTLSSLNFITSRSLTVNDQRRWAR